jgi:hypothetical protein
MFATNGKRTFGLKPVIPPGPRLAARSPSRDGVGGSTRPAYSTMLRAKFS